MKKKSSKLSIMTLHISLLGWLLMILRLNYIYLFSPYQEVYTWHETIASSLWYLAFFLGIIAVFFGALNYGMKKPFSFEKPLSFILAITLLLVISLDVMPIIFEQWPYANLIALGLWVLFSAFFAYRYSLHEAKLMRATLPVSYFIIAFLLSNVYLLHFFNKMMLTDIIFYFIMHYVPVFVLWVFYDIKRYHKKSMPKL